MTSDVVGQEFQSYNLNLNMENQQESVQGQRPDLIKNMVFINGPGDLGPGNEVLPNEGEVKFQMHVNSHFFLTSDLETQIHLQGYPAWPAQRSEIRRRAYGIQELTFWFKTTDVGDRSPKEWREFSQQVAAAISYCACVPVQVLSTGAVTIWIEPNTYSLTKLEPGYIAGGEMKLPGTTPVIQAINPIDDHHTLCLFFFHRALVERDPLYRFINLVICFEIWIGVVSDVERSKSPVCQQCHQSLETCPHCGAKWGKIPTPLSLHLQEVLHDSVLRNDFAKYRNIVFHPTSKKLSSTLRDELNPINLQLIKHFRNATHEWYALPPVDRLSESLNLPEVAMAIYFTTPGESPH